jgi:hypothetical protein
MDHGREFEQSGREVLVTNTCKYSLVLQYSIVLRLPTHASTPSSYGYQHMQVTNTCKYSLVLQYSPVLTLMYTPSSYHHT